MNRYVETILNIPVFSSVEVEPTDEGTGYVDVEFAFESLKKYNGNDLVVNTNWDIQVLNCNGELLDEFNLLTVQEFRDELLNTINKGVV